MLRYAYVDSTACLVPGDVSVNLRYAAVSNSAFLLEERVALMLGLSLEDEPHSESDRIKVSVARAILNDPDVLVMNAENMPRGDWITSCMNCLLTWHRGDFGNDTPTSLLWDELGTGRRRTLVVVSNPNVDFASSMREILALQPPALELHVQSRTKVILSKLETPFGCQYEFSM